MASVTMKLAEWLEHRAGLKGKKLEGAVKMCEDNWLETVGDLRELADESNNLRFKETFPQSMLRTAIVKALEADTDDHVGDEKAISKIELGVKEEARNR